MIPKVQPSLSHKNICFPKSLSGILSTNHHSPLCSLGKLGCHLDRHEDIGKGQIGISAFRDIVNEPRLDNIPLILETPGRWGNCGYKASVHQQSIYVISTKKSEITSFLCIYFSSEIAHASWSELFLIVMLVRKFQVWMFDSGLISSLSCPQAWIPICWADWTSLLSLWEKMMTSSLNWTQALLVWNLSSYSSFKLHKCIFVNLSCVRLTS